MTKSGMVSTEFLSQGLGPPSPGSFSCTLLLAKSSAPWHQSNLQAAQWSAIALSRSTVSSMGKKEDLQTTS